MNPPPQIKNNSLSDFFPQLIYQTNIKLPKTQIYYKKSIIKTFFHTITRGIFNWQSKIISTKLHSKQTLPPI